MAKFEALYGATQLIVPFIERNEAGQVIRVQSIVFNTGLSLKDKIIPANYSTNDQDTIKYLRAYGGNEANGGFSFKEIKEASTSKPVAEAKTPAAVVAEVPPLKEEAKEDFVFPDDLAESPEADESQAQDYPDVTTAQEAGAILRTLFPELTTRDTGSKAKIKSLIKDKNITFSNLDL